jgi:hypothetical protein
MTDKILIKKLKSYNEEEIRSFIPHARRIAMWNCSKENCENYETCDHIKNCVSD